MGDLRIPQDRDNVLLPVGDRQVNLTNLRKPFWPELGITKGHLIQYYVDVSTALLPHLHDRPMVMRRYPNGAAGASFFMKQAPSPRPAWIQTCRIEHSGGMVDYPLIQDLPALLWVVNLGCIDLNQWYSRCDDIDHPDYLHFDLDPSEGATFDQVREAAHVVHDALETLEMPAWAKTTGSRGIHIYVPIVQGPSQEQVWTFAKALATELAARRRDLLTTVYRVASRPKGRVLVDYNQNVLGKTLASVYSVRPKPRAPVSTPVTWAELKKGIAIDDFRIDNVPARIRRRGDLWAPLLAKTDRVDLGKYF
jgi:bifunctional non-homologous end joining protein LigD